MGDFPTEWEVGDSHLLKESSSLVLQPLLVIIGLCDCHAITLHCKHGEAYTEPQKSQHKPMCLDSVMHGKGTAVWKDAFGKHQYKTPGVNAQVCCGMDLPKKMQLADLRCSFASQGILFRFVLKKKRQLASPIFMSCIYTFNA
ncbi:NADH dehydrogenase [ubiquinone] 1 alpha subcomplex assembly factor 2 isoform X1 [Egretta garzetta]|uniref:NADH dehydrogenase [ubiquinone] 1 alpha subcomplex assembly factor 2 isoform X1 n=1 Tax=Egretta garzetta TaxID=188379 RepID=UPI00163B8156|nr:NADH dehydrogenase [ubiquinone] 1 alpha subcomplex assembly factor 2 isoform X1 [Egretta garzetta]